MIDFQSGYTINATKFILQDDFHTADTQDRIRKMQILRVGAFTDPRYGKFKITKQMLSEMVQNFHTGVRGVVPALDYKHDSEDIAAGWFKNLYLEGDELWAEIEMTPRGAKVLADKEFGYVSADFDTQYIDNEHQKNHGCVLLGAGLTNRPVVKRMESVIQLKEKSDPVSEKISKLIKEGYPQDQAVAIALEMERKGKLGENMDMEQPKKEEQPIEMSESEKKMADMEKKLSEMEAKLAESEKMCADYKKQLEDMQAPKKPEGEMKPEDEEKKPEIEIELAAAKKELAEAKGKIELAEKNQKFNVMLSEGKAVEAQREAYIKGDMESFASNAIAIKLSEVGHGVTPKTIEETSEDAVLIKAKKLSEEKKIGIKEAISEVLFNNKQLAEKIQQDKEGN